MNDEIYTDGYGNYYDAFGRPIDWQSVIERGIDVVGAWSSRSPYYSPDDPRFQGRGNYSGYGPLPGGNQTFVPGAVTPQGFSINWQTALIGGLLIGAFFIGRRR